MNDEQSAFQIRVSEGLIAAFADFTGDQSSIHRNPEFARETRFRKPVMHGMLPLLFLAGWSSRQLTGPWHLKKLSCRFLQPTFANDVLRVLVKEEVSSSVEKSWKFRVVNVHSGVPLTEGILDFSSELSSPLPAATGNEPIESALVEKSPPLNELTLGLVGEIQREIRGALPDTLLVVLKEHLRESSSEVAWVNLDDNFLSALFLSPLHGMELPGRYSTLAEIQIEFSSVLASGKVSLEATVEKIMMASSRVKLSTAVIQAGVNVAKGATWTIVGEATAARLPALEIQKHFLSSGLHGRVALITGASRGIGAATATLLAMQGAKVIVHYFQGKTAAQEIVDDILSCGGQAIALGADIRLEADVRELFREGNSRFGSVDVLVNSAVEEFSPKDLLEITWEDFLRELEVSLKGAHLCCQEAIPGMRSRRWGKIVNIGSVAVESPVLGQNKYITVKSALTGFTRSLAVELARDNIQVNLVVPQMTRTSLLSSLPNQLIQRLASESPSGVLLEPIDVARAISFLVSDWAGPISGQSLVLNQGQNPFS